MCVCMFIYIYINFKAINNVRCKNGIKNTLFIKNISLSLQKLCEI